MRRSSGRRGSNLGSWRDLADDAHVNGEQAMPPCCPAPLRKYVLLYTAAHGGFLPAC